MLGNKYIRYVMYSVGAAVTSEILYKVFLVWKNRVSGKNTEINEVLWTNDLTQQCREKHITKNSPCKTRYCFIYNLNRIVYIIENARGTIDLSMYIFTMAEVGESLLRAKKRGVKIRIICDESMVHSSGSQIIRLNKEGIPIRFQTSVSMLMHHKYCVCDGPLAYSKLPSKRCNEKTNPILITGSMNWTFQGFASNWDNTIVTSNKILIHEFEEEFERMWAELNRAGEFSDKIMTN